MVTCCPTQDIIPAVLLTSGKAAQDTGGDDKDAHVFHHDLSKSVCHTCGSTVCSDRVEETKQERPPEEKEKKDLSAASANRIAKWTWSMEHECGCDGFDCAQNLHR